MLPFSVDENSTSLDRVSTHSCPATESKPLPASWVDPLSAATTSHHQRKKSSSGAGKKDRGLARQKRNSWMRSSIVRRAATVVDEEVEALCEKSPFLNSTYAISAAPDVALFHRLEITLGERLGKGGFAEVFQVTGLDIDDDETNDEAEQKKRALRRQCQATIQSAPSGHPTFAVKFIKKKLLKNTREFQHAAIDLAVEAKYLAALSHPNIIKMRGMTVGGTSAFRAGKHDDFFILMDQMQETLDRRIQSWKRCQEEQEQQTRKQRWSPALHYEMSMKYALQIADALAYLHERAIVYRDLKPANVGFNSKDKLNIFDFGLSRELPKRKGQSQHDKDMEDEETFHMSGVGTQRYCAPEILTTRRYNLKADVYSWSMVFLELVTLNKPFQEYDPEEHVLNVAKLGERPRLVDIEGDPQEVAGSYDSVSPLDKTEAGECTSSDDEENKGKPKKKKASLVSTNGWPSGVSALLENSWRQDVGERLSIDAVLQRLQTIIDQFESYLEKSEKAAEKLTAASGGETGKDPINREVVLEFPSHFSPRHQLPTFNQVQAAHQQEGAPQEHITMQMNRQDSDCNSGDKQSEQSATSYLELTITSVSTTLHDSNSTE